MKTIRAFLVGVLLCTLFLATPQGQDSIIRLTGDGWLVAAGNAVPLLLGSNGKGFIKISEAGVITLVNGATLPTLTSTVYLAGDGTAAAPSYSFASAPTSGIHRITSNGNIGFDVIGTNVAWLSAIDSAYALVFGSTKALGWSSSDTGTATMDVSLSRGAADVLQLASGDKFAFGGVTSSFPMLKANGADLDLKLADDSNYANLNAKNLVATSSVGVTSGSSYQLASKFAINTAPTVTSAGTSPSITASNGTAAFRVNVGTGGVATTIVLAMPAATTGWNCTGENITAQAANRASVRTVLQSSTTTAATLQNQNVATGAATAYTASDIVAVNCTAY